MKHVLAVASFLLVLSAASETPAWFRDQDAVSYPTLGVVNPAEGTIEVRINPVKDLGAEIVGWPFVFKFLGGDASARTCLALLRQVNDSFDTPHQRFAGLAHSTSGTVYAIENDSDLKAGESAIYALVWKTGDALQLYRNGRLISRQRLKNPLCKLPPLFTVHDVAPLYADRVRVSTRALRAEELARDPSAPFATTSDASLVANDLEKPVFRTTPAFAAATPAAEPCAPIEERVLREGETFAPAFACLNPTDKPVTQTIDLTLTSLHDRRATRKGGTLRRTLEIPAHAVGQRRTLTLGKLPAGYYEISASDRTFRVAVLPAPPSAPEGALADWLGLANTRNAALFRKLDIRWMRGWNKSELLWHLVEPQRGAFDFRTTDRTVEAHRRAGVKVLATLGNMPDWAARKPVVPAGTKHRFSKTADRWTPRSLDDWRAYAKAVGERYADKVSAFEICNEIDFHPPALPASFAGTTEDYFAMLKAASETLHAVAPNQPVLVSGFSGCDAADAPMRRDLLKMGAADLVDAWNMHAYGAIEKGVAFRDELAAVKPKMPIWQTEFMWHVITDPFRQAYLTVLTHCQYLELGYAHFFGFGWGEYLSNAQTASPLEPLAATAVQQAYLRNAAAFLGRVDALPKTDFDVAYAFRRTDGRFVTLVGSSCGDYRLVPAAPPREVRDLFGRRLKAADGAYDLNGTLAYFVTDAPFALTSFVCTRAAELLPNGGFEDLAGDTLAGIDKCTPLHWELRTQRDPQGRIAIETSQPIAGARSVRLDAPSPRGDVYVFTRVNFTASGKYRLRATFRGAGGAPRPYLSVYGKLPGGSSRRHDDAPLADGETRELTLDLDFADVPEGTVAAIVGVRGSGAAVIDGATLEKR